MKEPSIYFKKRTNRNLISAKVTIHGQPPFEISTKISVPKGSDLKLEKGKLLTGSDLSLDSINYQLYEFRKKVLDIANKLYMLNTVVKSSELRDALTTGELRTFTISDILRQYLIKLEEGKVQNTNTGRPLSEKTIKGRISHITSLNYYVEKIDNLDLAKFNSKTSELIGKNKVVATYKNFWDSLVAVMYKNELDSNTINYYSVLLKIAIRNIIKDSELFVEPFLKEFKHQKTLYARLFLESKEYDFIINNYDTIMKRCSRTEKKTFQYAYVALWTCARSGDMKMWTKENLRKDGKIYWLDYITSKGNVNISIPLKDSVIKIFEENLKKGDRMLPRTTQAMAPIIKTILKRYPIFNRTIKTTRIKGGKKVIKSVPLWQLLTIHKMRGSAMTAMRRNRVPDNVIKQWSSHTENSRSYSMYFQTEKKELLDTAKAFYS